jgi:hypothetical protein
MKKLLIKIKSLLMRTYKLIQKITYLHKLKNKIFQTNPIYFWSLQVYSCFFNSYKKKLVIADTTDFRI